MNPVLEVRIGVNLFRISTFCYKKVGDTENMKFHLECSNDEIGSMDFDDYKSLEDFLTGFLKTAVFQLMEV